MSKSKPQRLAARVKRVAQAATEVQQREDAQAREIARAQAAAHIRDLLPADERGQDGATRPPMPALLIINSKSGPQRDSLLRTRELVDLLAGHGIAADVRVKLHKSQARGEARRAAKAGYPLVMAAGGDGTVAAVARGLVGTKTVLGVIPLGTYNNVATSLGIPTDVAQACALIAAAAVRAVDIGEVYAKGMKRRRGFLELGAVGILAPLAVAGQGFEKGRWDAVARHLPNAVEMSPAVIGIRLDGQRSVHRAHSMLAVVANTPRAGAGLVLAPQARIDDGLLDVRLYEEMSQPVLATHFLAVKAGTAGADSRIRTWRGRKLVIRSTRPLPVVIDSKVVGSTPVRFRVRSGGLLVIVGNGDGLLHPAAESLVAAIEQDQNHQLAEADNASAPGSPMARTTANGLELARRGRPLAIAIATGAAVALMPSVSRWINRHR